MAILSKGKLSKMMLNVLLELSFGTKDLKGNVTLRLGIVGQLSTARDINAAWNETKTGKTKRVCVKKTSQVVILLVCR